MAPPKKVIIIGGGVSGVGMAIQLRRTLNHQTFTIYERSDNIGGTWWHNRYPACACDIPSHFYSYSFAPKHDWTSMYPGRDELHAYFYSVAERYDILPHCRFGSECIGMWWDAEKALWVCTFRDVETGKTFVDRASAVVSAVGTLDRPFIPQIEGAESFVGKSFHSAAWDSSVNFKNKDVVVLGNGASATQFVPELVKDVEPAGKVTQLVRSAHWWTQRGNPTYSEPFKVMLKYVPFATRIYRILIAWELESVFESFRMDLTGARMRQQIRDNTERFIQEEAPAEYHDVLRPSYEPGCKRRVNTATYFKALHSPRMHLAKDTVTRVHPRSVETVGGKTYPADVLVYATGFQTQKWLHPMEVKGLGGRDLHEAWDAAGGAEAYKGTVVSGFPNFFILYGPNAATGQHSVIFHSECQINYSCRLLRPVLKKSSPAKTINVKPEAQARDLSWVHGKLRSLVFNSGCQSWWMDPETKKNTFIYPDPMWKYWLRTVFPVWSDFEIKGEKRGKGVFGAMKVLAGLGVGALAVTWMLDADKVTEALLPFKTSILHWTSNYYIPSV